MTELLTLAVALAAGNLWFSAARSTIPIGFEMEVVEKEVRQEKHPPADNVFLLSLDTGDQMQVDAPVYEAIRPGEQISKLGWSRELQHGGQVLPLEWSADYRGMRWAMPLLMFVLVTTAFSALWCGSLRTK